MQADFSVELRAEDDAMEMPWSSPGGDVRYYDLKRQPELLLQIQEAFDNQELGEFLASINSSYSILETCKCDTWATSELNEEEQIFGGVWKFGSYIDLVFAGAQPRVLLDSHTEIARTICDLLTRAPEISCAAEFAIRHCHFHLLRQEDSQQGFGMTFYLFGYGDDQAEARARWNIGMKLVENALLQISAQYGGRQRPASQ